MVVGDKQAEPIQFARSSKESPREDVLLGGPWHLSRLANRYRGSCSSRWREGGTSELRPSSYTVPEDAVG